MKKDTYDINFSGDAHTAAKKQGNVSDNDAAKSCRMQPPYLSAGCQSGAGRDAGDQPADLGPESDPTLENSVDRSK
jgi:hypothetical protein